MSYKTADYYPPEGAERILGWHAGYEPKPKEGEMIVTPKKLRFGFAVNLWERHGPPIFLAFRVIARLETGNYLVEDPSVTGI